MRAPKKKREYLSYEENVCHPYACAIQTCLKRNNYNENKCKKVIQEWRQCLQNQQEKQQQISSSSTSEQSEQSDEEKQANIQ